MPNFKTALNNILTLTYHNILRVEEEFLQRNNRISLTIREMHLIEYVGESEGKGRTISEIADYLNVARSSVTVAAQKLEKKGYLIKSDCETDGRSVRVTLSREGRRVFIYHNRFHMAMVSDIEGILDEGEKELLLRVIGKLNRFFEKSVGATV